ncbi:penicillin-binding protein activator [Litoribrevibacter albus]|uniref:Penicillin-binding protein activator n=1 Tax=Litoribrevibacter albus TaxID=1473156 RepID=A0AA37SFM3_9GAMM|nr:penicillin-binding protein activator [Litoribrevibacter albus]GLQ33244.1 penicillin-binding protein activator [Litoribrevibacter albus]
MDITKIHSFFGSWSHQVSKLPVYCLLILLSACSSTPQQSTEPYQAQENYIEQLLKQASTAPALEATELRLKASREFLNQKQYAESLRLLNQITPEQLTTDTVKAQYLLIKSIDLVQLEIDTAMGWLEQMSSDYLALLSEDDQWLWQLHYATELNRQQRTNEALSLLEFQRPVLNEIESRELSHFIWQMLEAISPEQLSESLLTSDQPVNTGWLQLALILNSETAEKFKGLAFNRWNQQYPNHPANLQLPIQATSLPVETATRIEKIALLLPLQGKFANVGKAISQGFIMAAYQLDLDIRPEIQIIDSLEGDFLATYNNIEADLIIGPLSPKHIETLEQLPNLPIPTIALNSTESEQLPVNFFYMNLQAEDEATTMARYAAKNNYKKGAILTYNSKKGQKLAQTFKTAFEQEQGSIAQIQGYETNWATSLQRALEIDKSDNRARNLSRLLRSPIEYTARRRNDIQFIYSPLKYKDLRQTNPLMAFFFADDIDVLSNSDISAQLYKGKRDKDLEGVIFSDFRWSPQDLGIQSLPTKAENSAKLYSWGADAFQMAIQFSDLITMHNHPMKAFGSNIYFDGTSRFIREFPVSYVRYGKPYETTPPNIEVN